MHLDPNNSLTGAVQDIDLTTDIITPANCYSMPDMTRLPEKIFWMIEHVRGGYVESILRVKIVEDILFRVWQPDFLQENYLGLDIAEQVREIMLVPLEAF